MRVTTVMGGEVRSPEKLGGEPDQEPGAPLLQHSVHVWRHAPLAQLVCRRSLLHQAGLPQQQRLMTT